MSSESIRTFVAVELPDTIKENIDRLKRNFMTCSADVKWVKTENIHITWKFLDEIPSDRVKDVQTGVLEAGASVPAFDLSLSGTGAFPDLNRPRVFWVDIKQGRTRLMDLQHAVEQLEVVDDGLDGQTIEGGGCGNPSDHALEPLDAELPPEGYGGSPLHAARGRLPGRSLDCRSSRS